MTKGTDDAKRAWRFWRTDGVPATGANEPDKTEIRAAFDSIGLDIVAAGSGGDPNAVRAVIEPIRDQALAAAELAAEDADRADDARTDILATKTELDSLVYGDTGRITQVTAPLTGGVPISDVTVAIIRPAVKADKIVGTSFYAGPGVTSIALKIFRLSSGQWVQVGADATIPATANALNEFSAARGDMPEVPRAVGDIAGWYTAGGGITYVDAGNAENDPIRISDAGNRNTVNGPTSAQGRFNITFDLQPAEVVERDTIDALSSAVLNLTDATSQTIGPDGPLSAGSAAISDISVIPAEYSLGEGFVTGIRCYARTAGPLKVRMCDLVAGVAIPYGETYTFNMVVGENYFTPQIPIKQGQRVEYYAGTRLAVVNGGDSINYIFGDILQLNRAVEAPDTIAATVQIAFEVSYREFAGAKLRVLSQAAYDALPVKDARTMYVIEA